MGAEEEREERSKVGLEGVWREVGRMGGGEDGEKGESKARKKGTRWVWKCAWRKVVYSNNRVMIFIDL